MKKLELQKLLDEKIVLWFFIGAIVIEILKFFEILRRGKFLGFFASFTHRAEGKGKLSIDLIKFFFYISGCLIALLAKAALLNIKRFFNGLIMLSIVSIFTSIISHGLIIRFNPKLD